MHRSIFAISVTGSTDHLLPPKTGTVDTYHMECRSSSSCSSPVVIERLSAHMRDILTNKSEANETTLRNTVSYRVQYVCINGVY